MQLIHGARDLQAILTWLRDARTAKEHERRAKLRDALVEPLWQNWRVPSTVLDVVLGIERVRRSESSTHRVASVDDGLAHLSLRDETCSVGDTSGTRPGRTTQNEPATVSPYVPPPGLGLASGRTATCGPASAADPTAPPRPESRPTRSAGTR